MKARKEIEKSLEIFMSRFFNVDVSRQVQISGSKFTPFLRTLKNNEIINNPEFIYNVWIVNKLLA